MTVRELGWRLAPGLMAERSVRWQFSHHPEPDEPFTVEAGPFAGLRYPAGMKTTSVVALKRAGTYEEDIAGQIAAAMKDAAHFIDIGAAESYYAVSAARRRIPTTAFESSWSQRRALRRLARANGVSVSIRRHCGAVPAVAPGSVCLIDAEGAEFGLLDQPAIKRLAEATVFVELHEEFVPGITEILRNRFLAAHDFEVVEAKQPEPGRGLGSWAIARPRP